MSASARSFALLVVFAILTDGSLLSAQELLQLDPGREIVCVERADGTTVRMQCDPGAKRCLVAQARILRNGEASGLVPQKLNVCVSGEPGVYERLLNEGYSMVPALLETPPGYTRDELGRVFQSSFDLRSRMHLGVYELLRFDAPEGFETLRHSLVLDTLSVVDVYDQWDRRRHRHRFLQARLVLAPLEIDALLYSYDRGRTGEEPAFWITTFIGGPRRFDVPIRLGGGISLGRLHYRRSDAGDLMLLDLIDTRINWEFYQGPQLENYALVRVGAGAGLRHMEGTGASLAYLYPEVGLEAAWVLGGRGLTHIGLDARMQWGWEPSARRTWMFGTAGMSIERILIAISDQPISLFVQPHVRYTQIEVAGLDGLDYRVLAGGRLSFFVPTRPSLEQAGH
ncbi:MAG: hypothetical protein H0U74_04685 [Bradymonadaceae bacterium]|nr:hypothetical protein [Lujinxingiaceae bacterium]